MVTAAQICLLLATNAVCLLVGWLVARRFTSDGPAVAAGSWASNGISDSSSGNLFGIVKVRSYRGPRLYAEWRADARAPARPARPHGGGRLCKNWAVTTSIFAPTVTVRQLAALPHWCLVVAGDKNGPKAHEYNVSGAIYLMPADQERLPSRWRATCTGITSAGRTSASSTLSRTAPGGCTTRTTTTSCSGPTVRCLSHSLALARCSTRW